MSVHCFRQRRWSSQRFRALSSAGGVLNCLPHMLGVLQVTGSSVSVDDMNLPHLSDYLWRLIGEEIWFQILCAQMEVSTWNCCLLSEESSFCQLYSCSRSGLCVSVCVCSWTEKPCVLLCSSMGRGPPVLLADRVMDGTLCGPFESDLCVNGRCQVQALPSRSCMLKV